MKILLNALVITSLSWSCAIAEDGDFTYLRDFAGTRLASFDAYGRVVIIETKDQEIEVIYQPELVGKPLQYFVYNIKTRKYTFDDLSLKTGDINTYLKIHAKQEIRSIRPELINTDDYTAAAVLAKLDNPKTVHYLFSSTGKLTKSSVYSMEYGGAKCSNPLGNIYFVINSTYKIVAFTIVKQYQVPIKGPLVNCNLDYDLNANLQHFITLETLYLQFFKVNDVGWLVVTNRGDVIHFDGEFSTTYFSDHNDLSFLAGSKWLSALAAYDEAILTPEFRTYIGMTTSERVDLSAQAVPKIESFFRAKLMLAPYRGDLK